MSIGGHFQFKHEKSWDLNTGPSLYDKYFEINMDDLHTALNTIPFYERNSIDEDVFSETDILTMNNRSTRFKQKYYNDKSYSTPETEALDKICSSLSEGVHESIGKHKDSDYIDTKSNSHDITEDNTDESHFNLSNMETKTNTETNNQENVLKTEVIEKIEPTIKSHVLNIENSAKHDIDFNFKEDSITSGRVEIKKQISEEPIKATVPSIPNTPVAPKVEPVVAKGMWFQLKLTPILYYLLYYIIISSVFFSCSS